MLRVRLYEFRERHKLTQAGFGALVGKTQPTVQRWEAGIHMPRPGEMRRIAEVTKNNVTPNDFHHVAAANFGRAQAGE
jgi:transcriptional regulator with XRE-family HTH domain